MVFVTAAEPAYRTPSDVIQDARTFGRAIVCRHAGGSRTDYVPIPDVQAGWWVRRHRYLRGELTAGDVVTNTDPVRSTVRQCWPDVELVPESESLFAEGNDG